MESKHTIFIVDDAEPARRMLKTAFEKIYTVETFENAEVCLERLAETSPDVFLLDVGLPGIDGYELCRRIRDSAQLADKPVIFISALDDLASALQGYEVGGDDFVVKPYKLAEVKEKIARAIRAVDERVDLNQRLNDSEMLNTLVLSSLDEYAILINFLRHLNGAESVDAVAKVTLEMLRAYALDGAIQIRLGGQEATYSKNERNHPLEQAVIAHIRSMDRIFQFKTRAGFNFEHLTLLVNDMPVEDADHCGRLRDHLSIAMEAAEVRLVALAARDNFVWTQGEIAKTLAAVNDALLRFRADNSSARTQSLLVGDTLLHELYEIVVTLGMSEMQEQSIQNVVAHGVRDFGRIFDFSSAMEATLGDISNALLRLQKVPG